MTGRERFRPKVGDTLSVEYWRGEMVKRSLEIMNPSERVNSVLGDISSDRETSALLGDVEVQRQIHLINRGVLRDIDGVRGATDLDEPVFELINGVTNSLIGEIKDDKLKRKVVALLSRGDARILAFLSELDLEVKEMETMAGEFAAKADGSVLAAKDLNEKAAEVWAQLGQSGIREAILEFNSLFVEPEKIEGEPSNFGEAMMRRMVEKRKMELAVNSAVNQMDIANAQKIRDLHTIGDGIVNELLCKPELSGEDVDGMFGLFEELGTQGYRGVLIQMVVSTRSGSEGKIAEANDIIAQAGENEESCGLIYEAEQMKLAADTFEELGKEVWG